MTNNFRSILSVTCLCSMMAACGEYESFSYDEPSKEPETPTTDKRDEAFIKAAGGPIDSVAYYRSIIDSLCRIKNDSVYVKKEVQKELSVWDKAKLQFGGWAFLFVLATIIYTIWCFDRKDKLNV